MEIRLMEVDAVDAALTEGAFAVMPEVALWALARPLLPAR
jgi:hypothetical protein